MFYWKIKFFEISPSGKISQKELEGSTGENFEKFYFSIKNILVYPVFYADSKYHIHFARRICSDRKVPGTRAKCIAFCYMLGKLNTFFPKFCSKWNSVPLTIPRIAWWIFLVKQIFSITYYKVDIVCKVFRTYYWVGKFAYNRRRPMLP
jgi:hypothetical protein